MKPSPVPRIPGKTEAEKFDNALRKVLSVSKEDLLKREDDAKRRRKQKKQIKRTRP